MLTVMELIPISSASARTVGSWFARSKPPVRNAEHDLIADLLVDRNLGGIIDGNYHVFSFRKYHTIFCISYNNTNNTKYQVKQEGISGIEK